MRKETIVGANAGNEISLDHEGRFIPFKLRKKSFTTGEMDWKALGLPAEDGELVLAVRAGGGLGINDAHARR